jgi:hypothetical protein
MAKFDHQDDGDFKIVASHISSMAEVAPSKIAARWELYEGRTTAISTAEPSAYDLEMWLT